MYVLGVSLPSQESEQSCVCVRGVCVSQEVSGECSCVCVRGNARRVSSHVMCEQSV